MNYSELIERGLCTCCGKPIDRVGALCNNCLERRNEKRKGLRAAGKCRCGRPKTPELANCDKCLEDRRKFGSEQREMRLQKHQCTICGDDLPPLTNFKLCEQCRNNDGRYREEIKAKVFAHYGNICNCCGQTGSSFLSIDHVEGRFKSGKKDTRKGMKLYQYLIKHDFPPGFQLLCFNCNCAKRDFGTCPHRMPLKETKWMQFKRVVYAKYNSKCVCCGEANLVFLTLDHVNGGGSQHRKELKSKGISIFRWLRENGYPPVMQILCFNCNTAKVDGACPHNPNVVLNGPRPGSNS